ncbi:MAG: hypothetical protein ABSA03_21995 [Streptosporangiaceae bacterium]
MRRIIRAAAPAAVLAAVLAAGCSASSPAPDRATAGTCYSFGVRALERHVMVTAVPRACRGLSHAQVNLAVTRAVREAVGPRPKAAARRLAERDSRYLGYLIGTVPPPAPASLAGGPARPPGDLAASLAALAAWIATAAAGSYLLAGWLLRGGPRRRPALAAGRPPAIIISHFALALAGLGIWIAFMAAGVAALAWAAVGLIVPAAGLGMAALVAAQPEPAPGVGTASPGPALAARVARTAAPGRAGTPVAVIVLHGVLAAATILLAVLAAIGAP